MQNGDRAAAAARARGGGNGQIVRGLSLEGPTCCNAPPVPLGASHMLCCSGSLVLVLVYTPVPPVIVCTPCCDLATALASVSTSPGRTPNRFRGYLPRRSAASPGHVLQRPRDLIAPLYTSVYTSPPAHELVLAAARSQQPSARAPRPAGHRTGFGKASHGIQPSRSAAFRGARATR